MVCYCNVKAAKGVALTSIISRNEMTLRRFIRRYSRRAFHL